MTEPKPVHPAERLRARSRARRCALQALYQWQLNGDSAADLVRQYRAGDELKKADQAFFEGLVIGALPPVESRLGIPCDQPVQCFDTYG